MNFFHVIKRIGESLQDLFLLLVRLFWGIMFLQAGLGKWGHFSGVIDFFRDLGIPFPEFSAYLTMFSEIICGALLILGLFTRVASIPLIIAMSVALATAHHEQLMNFFKNPGDILGASPFTFWLAALIALIFGPGRYSLDYFFCKKCRDKCDTEIKDK